MEALALSLSTGLSRHREAQGRRQAEAEARAKVEQEDRAKRELEKARKKKEQEEKDRPFYESLEKQRKADNAASRKVRERKERDVDLHDRRQGVEARELARSERRLDNYDAACRRSRIPNQTQSSPSHPSGRQSILSGLGTATGPSFVRSDGATLLYEGRGNSFLANPRLASPSVPLWSLFSS